MTETQHAAISEMLIETADTLAQSLRTSLAAGELLWGAAFHACSAADHHPDEPHRQPQTRRELREIINRLSVDRQTRKTFLDAVDQTVRRLHNNFYSGQLSNDELSHDIRIGTSFVQQVLRVTQQP